MAEKKNGKRPICRLIAAGIIFIGQLFPAGVNMLFIGNSFTFYHDLPTVVQALVEEGNPESKVKTEIVGYGGRNLFWHWEIGRSYNRIKAPQLSQEQWSAELSLLDQMTASKEYPAVYFDFYRTLRQDAFIKKYYPGRPAVAEGTQIDQGDMQRLKNAVANHQRWMKTANQTEKYDYVVLQSWQDEAGSPETGYAKYAVLFANVASAAGAKPVLYLTAPNNQNSEPGQKNGIRDQLLDTCRNITDTAKKIDAVVVPVPLALMLVQDSEEPIAKTLTFRYVKDFHPNNTMAYLTACTFYAALTGKSPEGLKMNKIGEAAGGKTNPDGGPLETIFDDETRLFLQRTAWKAVEQYRSGKY
ncbi:MAG: hypothetical protein HZC28_00660 [Spirochaetes bacterium]|nr:hypothetical protein [Spirochaetota bacterium]